MDEKYMSEENSAKNAWLYAVLMWFLGYLGIHKFYLNKTGWGIAYLLTGGLLGLGVIIDCIMVIFLPVRDVNGKILEGANSLRIACIIMVFLPIALVVFFFNFILASLVFI